MPLAVDTGTERPGPRQGYPVLPANGRRCTAREAPASAAAAFVIRQIASPWEPRTPEEVGRRGVGALRVLTAASVPEGWVLGSVHILHHAVGGFWCGTWEIEGMVTGAGNVATGRVPDGRLTLWRIADLPTERPPISDALPGGGELAGSSVRSATVCS